jgi:hypothetical protein
MIINLKSNFCLSGSTGVLKKILEQEDSCGTLIVTRVFRVSGGWCDLGGYCDQLKFFMKEAI